MYALLHNHILPYFKDIKLEKINKRMIEDWILKLSEKPGQIGKISPITINRIITCFGIMLNRAVDLEYIHRNPLKGIVKLKEKPKERGIFTLDEIKVLFSDDSIVTVWEGELRHFVVNILPLTSGMRQGEVLGLQIQNVHENYVSVLKSWSKKYGFSEPKWSSKRHIPIPTRTAYYLNILIGESPYQQSEDFVFWGESREKPLTDKMIARVLYKAMENIGIEQKERRERNLSYHSWRHTFNTLMRGRIADAKLQKLTGHRSVRMVDNYTHFRVEDFSDVLKIQEEYFK
jgi:integrase